MKNKQVIRIDEDLKKDCNALSNLVESVVFATGEVSHVSHQLQIQIDEKADTNIALEVIIDELEEANKQKFLKDVAEWISYTDFKKLFSDENYGNIKLHYDENEDLEHYIVVDKRG